jgi:hypothetical protein
MPDVTVPPPEEVLDDLLRLRSALDEEVPAKALDRNLMIATWNIRAFGDLTEKWASTEDDTLKRDYGESEEERVPELEAIAQWLAGWARDVNSWDHNLITLGDFNIDRKGDALHDAFISTGLEIPADLQDVPRTIFSDPETPDLHKFYDQIAWFTGQNGLPALSLSYSRGGYFDFTNAALTSTNLTRTQLSWRISDHYPLWTEFSTRD